MAVVDNDMPPPGVVDIAPRVIWSKASLARRRMEAMVLSSHMVCCEEGPTVMLLVDMPVRRCSRVDTRVLEGVLKGCVRG